MARGSPPMNMNSCPNGFPVTVRRSKNTSPWDGLRVRKILQGHPQGVADETINDSIAKNDKQYKLDPDAFRHSLVGRSKIGDAKNNPTMPGVISAAILGADSYYEISRPGFNAARDQAMFYIEYYCSTLCASAAFYFYIRVLGRWVQIGKLNLWFS
jgi:hypothetical protein